MPAELTELERKSLEEIPHPSLGAGANLYGSTKLFPDYQAEDGEAYLTLVHGIAHESSVAFVAMLQATRALRNAGREREMRTAFIGEGGKVYCCRFGLSLHGLREEDLIDGVIPAHPLDIQDCVIEYARKGAIINSTYLF